MVCDQRLLIWPREALYLLRELRSDVCKIRDQLPELDRLRAIEAAARNLDTDHAEPDGLWVTVPILVEHWNELRAALAAKET